MDLAALETGTRISEEIEGETRKWGTQLMNPSPNH